MAAEVAHCDSNDDDDDDDDGTIGLHDDSGKGCMSMQADAGGQETKELSSM
jgi:hypothetical protein